uniref:Putative secreted protein n=1 Tax=Anopheles darlingi TaxID=43151 RepID=A0A2M4D1H1_ANODA
MLLLLLLQVTSVACSERTIGRLGAGDSGRGVAIGSSTNVLFFLLPSLIARFGGRGFNIAQCRIHTTILSSTRYSNTLHIIECSHYSGAVVRSITTPFDCPGLIHFSAV